MDRSDYARIIRKKMLIKWAMPRAIIGSVNRVDIAHAIIVNRSNYTRVITGHIKRVDYAWVIIGHVTRVICGQCNYRSC